MIHQTGILTMRCYYVGPKPVQRAPSDAEPGVVGSDRLVYGFDDPSALLQDEDNT
jgi:hypothetical protein